MEWILFAIGVAVIGLAGIGLGLVAGRAWARRAEHRSGGRDEEFATPVGPPDAADRARSDQGDGPAGSAGPAGGDGGGDGGD